MIGVRGEMMWARVRYWICSDISQDIGKGSTWGAYAPPFEGGNVYKFKVSRLPAIVNEQVFEHST